MTDPWVPKRIGELSGPDAAVIRAILTDLQEFLRVPVFPDGVHIGDATRVYNDVTGVSSRPETRRVRVDTGALVVDP